jgi:hypothetical protein
MELPNAERAVGTPIRRSCVAAVFLVLGLDGCGGPALEAHEVEYVSPSGRRSRGYVLLGTAGLEIRARK